VQIEQAFGSPSISANEVIEKIKIEKGFALLKLRYFRYPYRCPSAAGKQKNILPARSLSENRVLLRLMENAQMQGIRNPEQ
jgi:hypothetical protein